MTGATGADLQQLGKAGRIGNLRGLLDAALFNEAYERTEDDEEAKKERAAAIKTGIGMFTSLVPDPTGSANAAGTLLRHFVDSPNVEPVDPRISADWSEDGNHVALTAYDSLAAHLNRGGEINDADYRRVQGYDAETLSEHVGAYMELLRGHDVVLPEEIPHEYTSRLDTWVASGADELEDLVDHGSMPGPG